MRFEIRLLGPLEVSVGGHPVRISGRPGVVLAVLAMAAGRIVSPDRLATAAWGNDLPVNPRASVYTNITRVRRLIGADLIGTSHAGYVLHARPEQIDALRFLALLDAASSSAADPPAEHRALTEALALWRGIPFEDVQSAWLTEWEAPRLVERYLTAEERRADLDLAAGRHDGPAARMRELIARYPLRESLWARLLSALDLAGRPAEALEHYETVRHQLADELGADPSPQLRAIHARLLAAAEPETPRAAAVVVPRQLPPDVPGFVGRDKVLAAMDGRLGDAASPLLITAIGGAAGIGKTALAVHWAHRVAGWFPDGQLYANLRGFDPSGSPRTPAEVLRGFLDALQVPAEQIPSGLDAQVGLYRSLLAGRRMLVVLDNARDAEQVRPLLPGSPGSQVVVTSRDRLTGLVAAEGARPVALDVLSTVEAWQLLEGRLGPQRAGAEPRATEQVIARCAGLPLALAVVAARAAQRPDAPMRALAAELEESRADLHAFAGSDPMTDVRAVFSWSYRTLSPPAARLFRLLSVHTGPDWSAPAAASIAGLPPARVKPLLAELSGAHLLTEPALERYAFHDLLRAYSAELAEQTDGGDELHEAQLRMFDHYLHTAHSAETTIDPVRTPIPMFAPRAGVTPEPVTGVGHANRWLVAERQVVVAVTYRAMSCGAHGHAWRLAWAVSGVLDLEGYWDERVALLHATMPIVTQEWAWQAFVHRTLGHAYVRIGGFDQAHHHLEQALALFSERGDLAGRARTHLNIGMVLDRQGRHEEMLQHSLAALDLFRTAGHEPGLADALNAVGWDHAQLGRFEQALVYCRESLEVHQRLDHRFGQADVWDSLGYIHRHLANYAEAVASYEQAVSFFEGVGGRYDVANTLVNLGDTHAVAGNPDGASAAWRRALSILDDLGHADAADVRTKLANASKVTESSCAET